MRFDNEVFRHVNDRVSVFPVAYGSLLLQLMQVMRRKYPYDAGGRTQIPCLQSHGYMRCSM